MLNLKATPWNYSLSRKAMGIYDVETKSLFLKNSQHGYNQETEIQPEPWKPWHRQNPTQGPYFLHLDQLRKGVYLPLSWWVQEKVRTPSWAQCLAYMPIDRVRDFVKVLSFPTPPSLHQLIPQHLHTNLFLQCRAVRNLVISQVC